MWRYAVGTKRRPLQNLQSKHAASAHTIAAACLRPQAAKTVKETADTFGSFHVLVSNASTNIGGTLETLTDDQAIERVMGKTLAAMRLSRAALPHLRAAGGGRIICIGGTAARTPGKTSLPSGLGNSSLVNFVKHFSNDVGSESITVNVVHPPFTKTDRYPARLEARAAQQLAEAEAVRCRLSVGRIVEPGDIAPMVLFWLPACGRNHWTSHRRRRRVDADGNLLSRIIVGGGRLYHPAAL